MLSYNNCPDNLPCMPNGPTIDGKPIYTDVVMDPGSQLNRILSHINHAKLTCPTLVNIGLLRALDEVEGVLAWNQTEKHPGAKWKRKSLSYHDAKSVSHLNKAQCGERKDPETLRSHRAHSCARLLMALAHELEGRDG